MSAGSSPYQTHRRDNPSISSANGSKSERSGRSNPHPAVESAVTRLLVSIKELLEALTKWSQQDVSDMHVSDVYVRLGNDFNAAVAAFTAFGIEMTELMSVPDDLRNILETCLAEDARPENLERFLPDVRKIITNLLQGLRGKQSIYRKIVSEHRHRSEASGHSRTDSHNSMRSVSERRRDTSGSQRIVARTSSDHQRVSDSQILRRTATTSSRRKDSAMMHSVGSPPRGPLVEDEEGFVGGFVSPEVQVAVDPVFFPPDRDASPPNGFGSHESGSTPPRYTHSLRGESGSPPIDRSAARSPPRGPLMDAPIPMQPQVPATVKRYSLVDKPLSVPSVVIDDASPSPPPDRHGPERGFSPDPNSPQTPPIDNSPTPAIANSLAALQKSDALERRASKRFSVYNIAKMTNTRAPSSSTPNRRSMAASNTLTNSELATLTEADDDGPVTPRKRERTTRRMHPPSMITEEEEEAPPPVPVIPREVPQRQPPVEEPLPSSTSVPTSTMPDKPFPVFLQVGRDVKKATIDSSLTLATLRMLFVDKFSYSPGLENFPSIYIRDASSGIQYELEDVEEVRERCLLSLNIEPLDQIKQHIDTQISSLAQDIKDLRGFVATNRSSAAPAPIVAQPFDESTPPASARPTDKQFQKAAGRLSRIWGEGGQSTKSEPVAPEVVVPQVTGQSIQSQMTGGSVMLSDFSNRIVGDLRTQFDEVQNLRRDLGVMRQLYTEFMKQTKDSLGTLRGQTHNVRQLATTKVSGARAYIQDGKSKLDSRSQNVLTKMEELQDTVETVKDDVIKRHISPKPHVLKAVQDDMKALANELESLKEHIHTVKPVWKKTWEEELQLIVEEQQFLSHQEEFLSDLQEDHKAVLEVYGHVEKVISLRGTNGGPRSLRSRGPGLKPIPVEGTPEVRNTVMAEIRGAAVDPERRMKAIAANQKNREKELATKSDEFQSELTGFVGNKKLKMTGGAEEAERVRQKRNDQTLKAMFTGSSVSSLPPLPSSPVSSSSDISGLQ